MTIQVTILGHKFSIWCDTEAQAEAKIVALTESLSAEKEPDGNDNI